MHLRKHLSHPHTKKTQVQQKISQRQPKSKEAEAPGRAKAQGGAHTCRGRSQRAEPARVRAEAEAQGKQTPPRPSETAGGQVPRALCRMRGSPHSGPDQVRDMCRAAPGRPTALARRAEGQGTGLPAKGTGLGPSIVLLKTPAPDQSTMRGTGGNRRQDIQNPSPSTPSRNPGGCSNYSDPRPWPHHLGPGPGQPGRFAHLRTLGCKGANFSWCWKRWGGPALHNEWELTRKKTFSAQ